MDKNTFTLDPQGAIEAICLDLRRYEPQTMLCAELLRIVGNEDSAVKRDPERAGLWIRSARQTKMRYIDGVALIDHVCTVLSNCRLSPQEIAGLCRRVFQTSAQVVAATGGGQVQISIATGMQRFHCRLCGRCCRDLDYHREVTTADVTRWQTQGRDDILKWVGATKADDQEMIYQIWVIPETNRFAEVCPFLKRGPANDQWICAIQETKPEICRQYPFTRKHGVMTGCMGFRG
jgi:Fe-S-cluster containining protein